MFYSAGDACTFDMHAIKFYLLTYLLKPHQTCAACAGAPNPSNSVVEATRILTL